jgi:hypothetical protein
MAEQLVEAVYFFSKTLIKIGLVKMNKYALNNFLYEILNCLFSIYNGKFVGALAQPQKYTIEPQNNLSISKTI